MRGLVTLSMTCRAHEILVSLPSAGRACTRPGQFTHPVSSSARMYSMTESLQPSMFIHLP